MATQQLGNDEVMGFARAHVQGQYELWKQRLDALNNGHQKNGASRRGRPRRVVADAEAAPVVRKKRNMSAAGRKAISDRMKKRWADRRAAAAKKPTKPTKAPPKKKPGRPKKSESTGE